MTRRRMRVAAAATLALAAVGACGSGDDGDAPSEVTGSDGIVVIDAWTRPTPPGVADAAIYLTVENRGAPDDRLVGARSDHCIVVTPHRTSTDDAGVTSMDEVGDEHLEVAPGTPLILEPNGLHLMCLGIEPALELGDTLDLELLFADHAPTAVVVHTERRP